MTITAAELGLYAVAILILFATPGPVWVALIARAMSGGFAAAWPLAVGVTLGDLLWPLLAILGLSWIETVWADFFTIVKWVAAATFLLMGWLVLRDARRPIGADSRLTRPGLWAGFSAGVLAILGNPKAIGFYMGMLPGFFDVPRLTAADIAAILAVSVTIPLLGNLALAAFLDRSRALLSSPAAVFRMNLVAGLLLIGVGAIIPFT